MIIFRTLPVLVLVPMLAACGPDGIRFVTAEDIASRDCSAKVASDASEKWRNTGNKDAKPVKMLKTEAHDSGDDSYAVFGVFEDPNFGDLRFRAAWSCDYHDGHASNVVIEMVGQAPEAQVQSEPLKDIDSETEAQDACENQTRAHIVAGFASEGRTVDPAGLDLVEIEVKSPPRFDDSFMVSGFYNDSEVKGAPGTRFFWSCLVNHGELEPGPKYEPVPA